MRSGFRFGSLFAFLAMFLLMSCATTHERLMDAGTSQLQLRSIQSRLFETADRGKTMRAIIATMQDLEFIVDEADFDLGSVTATKLNAYALRMTVTVQPRGDLHLMVRANAQFNLEPVTDPWPYQQFFLALEKSLFLIGREVN